MKVKNEVYKSVKIDWDNIVFPLKEGSPISPGGIVTNDKRAIGLIPYTYKANLSWRRSMSLSAAMC